MFDFPNSPLDGDEITHPNGKTYKFLNKSWTIVHPHDHDHDLIAALTARIEQLESQLELPFLLLE